MQNTKSSKTDPAEESYRKGVIKTFFKDGKLLRLPEQKRKKQVVLERIAERLLKDKMYSEAELDTFLLKLFADVALLKSELVNSRLLKQTQGQYHLA